MSDETQNTTEPNGGKQSGGNAGESRVDTNNPLIYDENGKKWVDKFWGASGSLKNLKSENSELQDQLEEIRGKLEEETGKQTKLKEQLADISTKVARISDLEDELADKDERIRTLTRYQVLTEYPELLEFEVEEEVENENGEVVVNKTNPLLDLVGSSGLNEDHLRQRLEVLAKGFGGLTQKDKSQDTMGPASPAPSETTSQDDLEAAYQRAVEAMNALNTGDQSPQAKREYTEAWEEYNKLKREIGG